MENISENNFVPVLRIYRRVCNGTVKNVFVNWTSPNSEISLSLHDPMVYMQGPRTSLCTIRPDFTVSCNSNYSTRAIS